MKVTNIGKRTVIIDGKPLSVGKSAIVPDTTDVSWFISMGQVRVEGMKIKEGRTVNRFYLKEELEKKKMRELRDIGKPLGAKDTSKSELIEEIIRKQR